MPSVYRVLSALAFGALFVAAPALAATTTTTNPTVDLDGNTDANGDENAKTVVFNVGSEILTYNGDGTSGDFPLVVMATSISTIPTGYDGIATTTTDGSVYYTPAGYPASLQYRIKNFVPFNAAKLGSGSSKTAFLGSTIAPYPNSDRQYCALNGWVDPAGVFTQIRYKTTTSTKTKAQGGQDPKFVAATTGIELKVVPNTAKQICLTKGTGSETCSAPTSLTFYETLSVGTVYKFMCGSSALETKTDGAAPLYLRFQDVESEAAPILGQLDWVSDAPAAPSEYDHTADPSIPAPRTVQIPFLANLVLNAALYVKSGAVNAQEPNYYAQVPVDTASNNQQDATQLAKGIVSFKVADNNGPGNVVNKIIGCYIKNADGSLNTVNDLTPWTVPVNTTVADYFPQCYFVATNGDSTNPSTNPQDVFTAKVQVHIRVLAACVAPSLDNKYSWDAVLASFKDSTIKDKIPPIIYDTYNNASGAQYSSYLPAQGRTITLQLARGRTTGSWPFYSFYSASDNSALQTDPILQYLFKNNLTPHTGAGTKASPFVQVGDVNATYAMDVGHPIICREVYELFVNDESGVPQDMGVVGTDVALPLVNDRTKFGVGKHNVECIVWDKAGNPSAVPTFTLIVNAFPEPTATTTDCDGPNPPAGACGDPQFTGFLGQSYQVHGVSGQIYNVLSTPHFQYNALFSYLSEGKCRKGTQCFSHPGNYFGQVGLLLRSASGKMTKVQVIAGAVDAGLSVFVDEVKMEVSAARMQVGDVSLKLTSAFELVVEAPEFSMQLANSDMFINQNVAINTPLLRAIQQFKRATKNNEAQTAAELEAALPHGLLGQTWQHKTYANRWKYIEGTLFEYAVADGLLGTDFKYNRF